MQAAIARDALLKAFLHIVDDEFLHRALELVRQGLRVRELLVLAGEDRELGSDSLADIEAEPAQDALGRQATRKWRGQKSDIGADQILGVDKITVDHERALVFPGE